MSLVELKKRYDKQWVDLCFNFNAAMHDELDKGVNTELIERIKLSNKALSEHYTQLYGYYEKQRSALARKEAKEHYAMSGFFGVFKRRYDG